VAQDSQNHSSFPAQSALTGLYLLSLALTYQVPAVCQATAMCGGLFGLLAGVGLDQSRKRVQFSLLQALSLRQHILLQTHGHLHDLTVEVTGDRARVGGVAATYHLMQLAHSAALDVLGSNRTALDFNIRVRKAG
jgi:hypothetical protein